LKGPYEKHYDTDGTRKTCLGVKGSQCEERLRTAHERPFLREEQLSNARERGLCKANAGHAPRGMVSRGPEALLRRYSRGVTPVARALLSGKRCLKNLYSSFLLGPKRVAVSKNSARIDAVRSEFNEEDDLGRVFGMRSIYSVGSCIF
jgi:hypothetical protein